MKPPSTPCSELMGDFRGFDNWTLPLGLGFDSNKQDLSINMYRDLTHEVAPVMGDLITP